MNEKQLLSAFLSATLNMDETAVASLYNEDGSELKTDALDTLKNKDVERVKKLKPNTQEFFDNGYKKAQSEVLGKFEREFQEKTGFQSDKKGIDLVLEFIDSKGKKPKDLNDDDVKKHPVYISAVEKLNKEKEEAVKSVETKLEDFQKGIKKQEVFNSVGNKAIEIFNGLKPILSQDPTKQKNQMSDFVNKLKEFEYEIQEDRVVVLKDGKVYEDAHGNRIPFEKVVQETANRYYDFHKAEQRTIPNNSTDTNQQQKKTFNFQVPNNEDEYVKAMTKPGVSLEERAAIAESYKQKQLATNN